LGPLGGGYKKGLRSVNTQSIAHLNGLKKGRLLEGVRGDRIIGDRWLLGVYREGRDKEWDRKKNNGNDLIGTYGDPEFAPKGARS